MSDDETTSVLSELNDRSRDIFRELVETYLNSGEPVGSRTLSHAGGITASAATVRNVMADLTDLGLLYSPHTSAGRMPTERGLRLFVDGLLEVGDLSQQDRDSIEAQIAGSGKSVEEMLTEASSALSGLTSSAGLVFSPNSETPLKHVEFVATGAGQALVVMVAEDGRVENRVIDTPMGLPASAMDEASNFLSARLRGRTINQARDDILKEIETERVEVDQLTAKLVEAGIADRGGANEAGLAGSLIVRGRANLLEEGSALEDLERVRMLFDDLEQKSEVVDLLEAAKSGEGIKIFIGSENRLFSLSGSSVIVKPYKNSKQQIVGVLGVIGPTRLNYARVIPMVDYTAEVVSSLLK